MLCPTDQKAGVPSRGPGACTAAGGWRSPWALCVEAHQPRTVGATSAFPAAPCRGGTCLAVHPPPPPHTTPVLHPGRGRRFCPAPSLDAGRREQPKSLEGSLRFLLAHVAALPPNTSFWARAQVPPQGFRSLPSVWLGPWEAAYPNSLPKESYREERVHQPNKAASPWVGATREGRQATGFVSPDSCHCS